MPEVEVEHIIAAPREQVYEAAKNMEAFLEFMPNAKDIRTYERFEEGQLTEWTTQLKGKEFKWSERETFDDDQLKIYYEQVEGDLAEMKGDWTFEDHPEGTRVIMTNAFEFGMPALEVVLNPVASVAIKNNLKSMLEALESMIADE
jgi:ribosome-associated toxin RatA of RatAB toxin-antitoxin module